MYFNLTKWKAMSTKRIYPYCKKQIDFRFSQNKYDFIVDEIKNKKFTNKGNYLILHIKKIYLSTWELIKHISATLDIEEHKIGYAGLKDKNATTTQYISIPLMKEKYLERIETNQVKILEVFRDSSKLSIGDLEGNTFKIALYDIKEEDSYDIFRIISKIQKHGMPNYFGFQRFGKEFDLQSAKEIAYGETFISNKKLEKLLCSAYQSYYFNEWLAQRMYANIKEDFNGIKVIEGDVLSLDKKYVSGLLVGRNILRAKGLAREIEEKYDDEYVQIKGYRRNAWVEVKNFTNKYIKEENKLILTFTLPKSSYATVLIENLAMKNFSINDTSKYYKK